MQCTEKINNVTTLLVEMNKYIFEIQGLSTCAEHNEHKLLTYQYSGLLLMKKSTY